MPINAGTKAVVTSGNCRGWRGTVQQVDDENGRITVQLAIFGRNTNVTLALDNL